MTKTERYAWLIVRLADAIEELQTHVEALGCTCGDFESRQAFHAPSRRRRDSKCTGVALAVEHRGLVRRARQSLKSRRVDTRGRE